MNALHQKYGSRGLSIVGVTGADKENTDAWARKLKVSYPYAYDHQFTLAGPFNVSVLPIAILVAPSGTVVYHGTSDALPEATLRKHLAGAIDKPLADWPAAFSAVKRALLAREYGMALSAADALPDDLEGADAVKKDVRLLIESAVKGFEEAVENEDFLAAHDLGHHLKECLEGRPEEERIDAALKKLEGEKAVAQMEAQLEVRVVRRQPVHDLATADVVVEQLEALVKAHQGTVAGRQAAAHLKFVRRVMPQLQR